MIITYKKSLNPHYPFEEGNNTYVINYPAEMIVIGNEIHEVDKLHHHNYLICDIKQLVSISFPEQEKKDVYILTCEDASHLGGMMGTEYVIFVFSKSFDSTESAKKYAEEYQGGFPSWSSWKVHSNGDISCDSSVYIWTIKKG
jgi:hypothetical protein